MELQDGGGDIKELRTAPAPALENRFNVEVSLLLSDLRGVRMNVLILQVMNVEMTSPTQHCNEVTICSK